MIALIALLCGGQALLPAATTWQTDWKTAFRMARDQHRLVFVDYYQNKCQPCQEMESVVLRSPDTLQRLSDFVLLRLDLDRSAIPPWFTRETWRGRSSC